MIRTSRHSRSPRSRVPLLRHVPPRWLGVAVLLPLMGAARVGARDLIWDNATGNGRWDLSSRNWHVSGGIPGTLAFASGDSVSFTNVPGLVDVADNAIVADRVEFALAGFVVTNSGAGSLTFRTLTHSASSGQNVIRATLKGSNVTGRIAAGGTLVLTDKPGTADDSTVEGVLNVAGNLVLRENIATGPSAAAGRARLVFANGATLLTENSGGGGIARPNDVDIEPGAAVTWTIKSKAGNTQTSVRKVTLNPGSVFTIAESIAGGFIAGQRFGFTGGLEINGANTLTGVNDGGVIDGELSGSGTLTLNMTHRLGDEAVRLVNTARLNTFTGAIRVNNLAPLLLQSSATPGAYDPAGQGRILLTFPDSELYLGHKYDTATQNGSAITNDTAVSVRQNGCNIRFSTVWPTTRGDMHYVLGSATNPLSVDGAYTVDLFSDADCDLTVPWTVLGGNGVLNYAAVTPAEEWLRLDRIDAGGNPYDFTKQNTGRLIVGASDHGGKTRVEAGTLELGSGAFATARIEAPAGVLLVHTGTTFTALGALDVSGGALFARSDLGAVAATLSAGELILERPQTWPLSALTFTGGRLDIAYPHAAAGGIATPPAGSLRFSADQDLSMGATRTGPVSGAFEINRDIGSNYDGVSLDPGSAMQAVGAARGYASDLLIFGSVRFGGGGQALRISGQIGGPGKVLVASDVLTLEAANGYEGGTDVSGGRLNAAAVGALGTGDVSVVGGVLSVAADGGAAANRIAASNGGLVTLAAQGAGRYPRQIRLNDGGALGGDITGARYTVPDQNTGFAAGAVLAHTNGPAPTCAQLRAMSGGPTGCILYRGATSLSGAYDVGDNGTSADGNIYMGVAFGSWTPAGAFTGTVNDRSATLAGLRIRLPGNATLGAGATLNTDNPLVGAVFSGPGLLTLNAWPAGSAALFSRTGTDGAPTRNQFIVHLDNGAVAAGKTLNVTYGVVRLGGNQAAAGNPTGGAGTFGTVNVNEGAALHLSSGARNVDTGLYRINRGGWVITDLEDRVNRNNGRHLAWSDGAGLVIADAAFAWQTALVPTNKALNVVLLGDQYNQGIWIGHDSFVTCGWEEDEQFNQQNASDVRLAAKDGSVGNVIFTVPRGRTLTLNNNNMVLANDSADPARFANLQIGFPAGQEPYVPQRDDTDATRMNFQRRAHDGTLNVTRPNFRVGDVTVRRGRLNFDHFGATFRAGNIRVDPGSANNDLMFWRSDNFNAAGSTSILGRIEFNGEEFYIDLDAPFDTALRNGTFGQEIAIGEGSYLNTEILRSTAVTLPDGVAGQLYRQKVTFAGGPSAGSMDNAYGGRSAHWRIGQNSGTGNRRCWWPNVTLRNGAVLSIDRVNQDQVIVGLRVEGEAWTSDRRDAGGSSPDPFDLDGVRGAPGARLNVGEDAENAISHNLWGSISNVFVNVVNGSLTLRPRWGGSGGIGVEAGGAIDITSGETIGRVVTHPNGRVRLTVNSTLTVTGELSGLGALELGTGTAQLTDGATLAPGGSAAGALSVTGNLALADATLLTFDLGDPFASDQVLVAGNLTLDGVLTVRDAGGLLPGDYVLMTCTGDVTDRGLRINPLPGGSGGRGHRQRQAGDSQRPGPTRGHGHRGQRRQSPVGRP